MTWAQLGSPEQDAPPEKQGPNSPNHLNKSLLIWAWRAQWAPAHCQVCSLIHQSWPAIHFFLDAYSASSYIQSLCFLSTFPRGVIVPLPSWGNSSQKAGPLVWPYFLHTKPFFTISQAYLQILSFFFPCTNVHHLNISRKPVFLCVSLSFCQTGGTEEPISKADAKVWFSSGPISQGQMPLPCTHCGAKRFFHLFKWNKNLNLRNCLLMSLFYIISNKSYFSHS